jgi:hypothetical protein
MFTAIRTSSIASVLAFAAASAAFAQDVIVETVIDDTNATEIDCGDRLNKPITSTDSAGNQSETPVNTQHIVCADTLRTFEIISERAGG